MPPQIGTKQGITYYCECKHMSSILNPTIDNQVYMRYTGFFDEMWNEYGMSFDNFGYGLKKTRVNKGVILSDNAFNCFGSNVGYVGMVLSLPHNINNGVYAPLSGQSSYLNEYLLWGVNVGEIYTSYPSICARLTTQGVEFTVWSPYGKYTIIDNVSTIYANNKTFYEFLWDATPMDDFSMDDFDATMVIRINGEDIVAGGYPIGAMDLSGLNFCAFDSPANYYNLECILSKLFLCNEVPVTIKEEWHSSSSSSSSESE